MCNAHFKRVQITLKQRASCGKNLTLEDNNTKRVPFRVEKIEKKTKPIHVEANRDGMVNELLALHKPVSG